MRVPAAFYGLIATLAQITHNLERAGGDPINRTRKTPATRPGAAGPQSKKTYLIDNGTIREKSGKVQGQNPGHITGGLSAANTTGE